jgi:hypothetical protein
MLTLTSRARRGCARRSRAPSRNVAGQAIEADWPSIRGLLKFGLRKFRRGECPRRQRHLRDVRAHDSNAPTTLSIHCFSSLP